MKAAVVIAWPKPTERQRADGDYPVALEYDGGSVRVHVVTASLHRYHEVPVPALRALLEAIDALPD